MKYQKARNKKAEPKHIPECGECVRSERIQDSILTTSKNE